MDWTFIFFVCCLLFLDSLSSVHSASETRTTSRGNSMTFPLPEEENVVVAFLTEGAPSQGSLNYRLSVHGREIDTEKLDYSNSPSQWKPLLFVSKEAVRKPSWKDFSIPEKDRELKGRQVEVSSWHEVKWQVLSLPLNDYDVTVISPNQESPLNLPDHYCVWITLWNKNKFDITVRFYLSYENPRTTINYELTANEGWMIMSISTDIIIYGNGLHHLWGTQLEGLDLRITTNHQLHLQAFPMPLEPQETRKLPGTTTGMYTATPIGSSEGPLKRTPTVKPPIKAEGPLKRTPTVAPPIKPEGPLQRTPTVAPPVKPEGPLIRTPTVKPPIKPEGPLIRTPTVKPSIKPEGPLIRTPTVKPPIKPEGPLKRTPTATPPIKPEGPLIRTPTVKPPIKPGGTATGIPVSTLIIIGVVVALLVVVAASYLCYRCYFKKQNETRPEGIAMEEHPGTVSHPGSARPNLPHNTENPLYGKIAPRDVTGIARPLHRDRLPRFHRLPLEKESCKP
ncbi:uncharacterized protein [Macrobrachium rosenbergii]|uniref:uncharacterized protein isoform X2 n=1 Tax=Macrobrachium rosenbergii TaxID=79674 RepID=UPI0034D41847